MERIGDPPDLFVASPVEPVSPSRGLSAPVAASERVASVDVLRGFALLGILVMNIHAFALPWACYTNPLAGGGSAPADRVAWWVTYTLFEMKFMTLFSMLFGAGLALMAERAAARGGRFGGVYYRRCLWLLVIGLVHAYLMWYGDILVWYALCGLILYPLRRMRPRLLIPVGAGMVGVVLLTALGFGYVRLPAMKRAAEEARAARSAGGELTEDQTRALAAWKDFRAGSSPTPEDLEEEITTYKHGSWIEQVAFRAPDVLAGQTADLLLFGFWRVAGLMLVGMGLLKLGVFSGGRSTLCYAWFCVLGYGIGLPLVLFGARELWRHQWDPMYTYRGGFLPNYFGSVLVAMGHVGLVMLVHRAGALRGLTSRLAAVGRMALTNYLSQTLIATTVFYSWGLGLFYDYPRSTLMLFVLGIWIVQLVASPIWLRHFRFGPAEWLWRSLTYWRRQPMRVRAVSP